MYGIEAAETLTSAANPLLKEVRRAVQKGSLTADGLCVAEGFHLLREALGSRCEVPVVIAGASAAERVEQCIAGSGVRRLVVVADHLFQTLSSTETSQGVIALARLPEWQSWDVFAAPAMTVVLDGLQDPGNAGAIARAAEAFGATGLIYTKGSVHPHHPKALRASAGSLFRVPFLAGLATGETADQIGRYVANTYAATPWTGVEQLASAVPLDCPFALIIGSEGRGISPELRGIATAIAIPTAGVESLNAAVAAAVLLYEARRQRA